jgi:predicted ester cyclase
MFRKAFPDGAETIEEQIGEGDRVATRTTYRGTHTGELMGIPPTGKEVVLTGMIINRLMNGKIRERRVLFDQFGLLQQLGVVPMPG